MLLTMLQTSINDEFIFNFQYDMPLSEVSLFQLYELSHTVSLVQTTYIEICK